MRPTTTFLIPNMNIFFIFIFLWSGIHNIASSDWLDRGSESYDTDLDSRPLTAKCRQKNETEF